MMNRQLVQSFTILFCVTEANRLAVFRSSASLKCIQKLRSQSKALMWVDLCHSTAVRVIHSWSITFQRVMTLKLLHKVKKNMIFFGLFDLLNVDLIYYWILTYFMLVCWILIFWKLNFELFFNFWCSLNFEIFFIDFFYCWLLNFDF